MRRATVLLSALAILALPGLLLAHGHGHVTGTITVADATHLEVKTKDGKSVSVPLGSATKYFKGKAAGAAGDAKVGSRVVVHLAGDGTASEVRLSATPAKGHTH